MYLLFCILHLAKPDRYFYRTARVGQTVKFPCESNLVEDVHWKRMDTFLYIYRRGAIERGLASRFTVDKNNSNMLTILNITANDSAVYECSEDGGLGSKRFYNLNVTG